MFWYGTNDINISLCKVYKNKKIKQLNYFLLSFILYIKLLPTVVCTYNIKINLQDGR
jgi:hypothetical protein